MQDEIPHQDMIGDYGLHGEAAHSVSGSPSAAAPTETSPPSAAAASLSLEDMAREAARRGPDMLREFFNKRTRDEQKRLRKIEGELIRLYPPVNGR